MTQQKRKHLGAELRPYASLLGLDLMEARRRLKEAGGVIQFVRALTIDGEGQPAFMDLRHDRINVDVEDNVIVRLRDIG